MPIKEFQCGDCGHIQEYISNDPTDKPEECRCGSTKLVKLFSAVGGYKINGNNSASVRPKSAGSFKRVVKVLLLGLFLPYTAHAVDFTEKQYTIMKELISVAQVMHVDPTLLTTVCFGESSFILNDRLTHIDHGSRSYGVCQVKLATARYMDKVYQNPLHASRAILNSIHGNAFYAAQYLKYQLLRYNNNWKRALNGYNRGKGLNKDTRYIRRFKKNHIIVINQLEKLIRRYIHA